MCANQIFKLKQMREKKKVFGAHEFATVYSRITEEALMAGANDIRCDGKLPNTIKTMYADCEACVRVYGGNCESFKIVVL